ncbi:unnamed protein product [Adineta steineri]|uniref:Uncharacterized protein n=1 Tax=Adineta steineri TaxID=433720 RepID=A0A815CF56_9BILA|nr:unnamed protein product [Adineta steineri]CAF1283335.1 unnamed protein product [Adineta steineri]
MSTIVVHQPSQTPPLHHLLSDPHSTDHVQQQHSIIASNMALAAEREAYLRLAQHSMDNSRQFAPNINSRSPKAYGGYIVSSQMFEFLFVLALIN